MKILVITALLVAVTSAHARIYKCIEGDAVSFSDRPCPAQFKQEPTAPVPDEQVAETPNQSVPPQPADPQETAAPDDSEAKPDTLVSQKANTPADADSSKQQVVSPQATLAETSPPKSIRRNQLEASIAVAKLRIKRLNKEKQLAMDAFGEDYSLDAQILAHHYSTIIRPLKQELADMESQLAGMRRLSAHN